MFKAKENSKGPKGSHCSTSLELRINSLHMNNLDYVSRVNNAQFKRPVDV